MGFFRCRDGNGQMVRLDELCDGNATCDDGFDEINPLCAGTYIKSVNSTVNC